MTPPADALHAVDRAPPPSAEPPLPAPRGFTEFAARTTAVLAVLAAVASGQYAESFSRTILAQTEASDAWSYYQAKSIKKYLAQGQHDLAVALAGPGAGERLAKLEQDAAGRSKRYDEELAEIKAKGEALDAKKLHFQKRGERFQWAFIALQAGVVLSTVAASSRRRELLKGAIAAGILGLFLAADAALLLW